MTIFASKINTFQRKCLITINDNQINKTSLRGKSSATLHTVFPLLNTLNWLIGWNWVWHEWCLLNLYTFFRTQISKHLNLIKSVIWQFYDLKTKWSEVVLIGGGALAYYDICHLCKTFIVSFVNSATIRM